MQQKEIVYKAHNNGRKDSEFGVFMFWNFENKYLKPGLLLPFEPLRTPWKENLWFMRIL